MNRLVASYLQYSAEPLDEDEDAGDADETSAGSATATPATDRAPWIPGMGTVQASPELRAATTAEAALDAATQLFFGPLMEI